MHKNDRGASMLRKRLRQEYFSGLFSGKSLGSERSVSRSREPSQHSRGDSSVRADTSVYIPAHQRGRRIGESNSDSRRKEFYDRRRETESSRNHGYDYAKDRDRSKDYGKDKERDWQSETQGVVAETLHQIVAATPERKWMITRHAQGIRGRSRHKEKAPRLLSSSNAGSIRLLIVIIPKLIMIIPMCGAPAASEADRADDRLLSASIPHPSRNPCIPSLHVDVLPNTGAWSTDYINEATAAWLRSVGIKRKECSVTVCSGIGTPQQFCVPCRGVLYFRSDNI
jgi:hypothetical protein